MRGRKQAKSAKSKLGTISDTQIPSARNTARKFCERNFRPSYSETKTALKKRSLPRAEKLSACKVGADFALDVAAGNIELGKSKKNKLGFFLNCADPCREGFERVTLKKDEDGRPTVCVCRLDPDTRKKFRGEKYKVPQEKRKPFGKWKTPVHLRRCIEFDERGRCRKKGLPGLEPKNIRR